LTPDSNGFCEITAKVHNDRGPSAGGGLRFNSRSIDASHHRFGRPTASPHRSPLPQQHVTALASPTITASQQPTSPPSQRQHHALPHAELGTSVQSSDIFSPIGENQPSNISASSPRISSMDSFSLRMLSRSSSWLAVALTLMSANLDGNRMLVSSQDRAL